MKNNSYKFISMPGTEKSVSGDFLFTGDSCRRVLGIDPGLASTGWGIVDYRNSRYRLAALGVIETDKDQDRGQRLLLIHRRLCAIIEEYSPNESAMETLYFAKNVSSAMGVAEARGAVTLCLAQHCIPLGEYSPNCIKQSVTGSARADKILVQDYVKLLLGLAEIPKPNHAADALAVAITHIHSSVL